MITTAGNQTTSSAQIGQFQANIENSAPKAQTDPAIRMTKVAAPSPVSNLLRSKPQASQDGANLRKPSNRWPSPQLGHRPRAPAA